MTRLLTVACSFVLLAALLTAAPAAEFTVEKTDDGVTVKLDGKLFTEYLITSGAKPYLWPIIGPNGKRMTRAYPMEKIEGERHDHHHHRSFWFTHGEVNGVDFWSETEKSGKTVHRKYLDVSGGKQAVIKTVNDWMGKDGKVLEDVRTITMWVAEDGSRVIDFDITLTASAGDVVFGDTKEGSFGVRVPTSMDVDSKKGGSITTSSGVKDKASWGKQAGWVDYYGPVEGETAGVAILNHPSSFRYPTYWHVRTYGLFAANPFGLHHFKGVKDHIGRHEMKRGESISLYYRVIFHQGDTEEAKIADAWQAYQQVKK